MQQETLRFASFSNQAGPERRRYPRQKLTDSPPVLVEIAPGHRCEILDIGEGGMSLRSDSYAHFPPQGRFSFTVPGSNRTVEVLAQLAWVNRQGAAGLKFLAMDWSSQNSQAMEVAGMREHSFSNKTPSSSVPAGMSLVTIREKVLVLRSQPKVALQLIAKQMLALTRATGAVIAMQDENSTITCVASAGRAPGIGTVLKPDSGLSGECVRSGTIVNCDDAEHDARVAPEVSKALGFCSMIVFPLRVDQRTIGIMEILAPQPHHFTNSDVALLTNLAELVLDLNQSAKPSINANHKPEQKTEISVEQKPAEVPKLELVKPRRQEQKAITQSEPCPTVPLAQPVVKQTGAAASTCDVCGYQNSAGARDCENCDVPLPAAIEMEAKTIKRSAAYEIPERDDRWERLASALLKPTLLLILLIVAFILIRSHWKELRAASYLLQDEHPASSTASSTAISRR